MTETKEFHELFQQTNGRIFALLISTDGRGHYDSRGRLALDYCAAGQTFDLPKGMFSSDKYRDTDVVLTFAKLEYDDKHKDEYLLVDAHSAKESIFNTSDTDTPETRSRTISFNGGELSIREFCAKYQNKVTLLGIIETIKSYPTVLNSSELFYKEVSVDPDAEGTYNNSALRKTLYTEWCIRNKEKTYKPEVIENIKDSYYIDTTTGSYKKIAEELGQFDTIFQIVDGQALINFKNIWVSNKKVFTHKPDSTEVSAVRNAKETDAKKLKGVTALDTASAALNHYIEFLTSSPILHLNPRNLIYFGAPGTGKSYTLNGELEQFEGRYERVTFYSDYLHAQFVGSFRPQAVTGKDDTADFTYAFTPGPFTRVLINALNDTAPTNEHVLVIEEINRADPAAVFGDIFQLLDRDSTGTSAYPVTVSEDMKSYLWKELESSGQERLLKLTGQSDVNPEDPEPKSLSIAIPSNMLIWATMNSADQGVYPMDTAFKRRWNFRYIDINAGEDEITDSVWKKWRRIINDLLLTKAKVSEDKLLGPFFLGDPKTPTGTTEFDEAFKNKVIMYLFEDAAKYKRNAIFNENRISDAIPAYTPGSLTLQALFSAWDKIQFGIFNTPNE